jgi:hypothetical protein
MRVALNQVKMGKNEDPVRMFERLAGIKMRFNTTAYQIPQDELMAVAMQKAPSQYDGGIGVEMRIKGDALTMQDLQEMMSNQYQISSSKSGANNDNQEIGSVGAEGRGVKCYNCQLFGHRAFNCTNAKKERKDNGEKKPKFTGKCATCGKQGQKAETCWTDPKNASKVPEWLKKKSAKKSNGGSGEAGMAGVEVILTATGVITRDEASQDHVDCNEEEDGWLDVTHDLFIDDNGTGFVETYTETMLMGVVMEFPMVMKFLEHPNVWVGDTAASCDSLPHKIGMTNIKTNDNNITIENGNGSLSEVVGSGELRGTICNKYGMKVGKVKMPDVQLTPGNKYTLFSISKRLKEGWTMMGNAKGMILKKGDQQVKFDLVIPTHKGVIFAMYINHEGESQEEVAGIGTTTKKRLNIKKAHELLGHMIEDMTRKAAKHLGWEITKGTLQTCE